MTADSGADQPDQGIGSSVAEETTRVEAVQYLEGASGHGVFSLLLLVVAAVLVSQGMVGAAVVAGIIAYGVTANGLSIYLWDELRSFFATTFRSDDATTTRTLRPHRVTAEVKAELASGVVMVGGLCVFLVVALALFRTLSPKQAALIAVGGLAVGNLGALGWAYLHS